MAKKAPAKNAVPASPQPVAADVSPRPAPTGKSTALLGAQPRPRPFVDTHGSVMEAAYRAAREKTWVKPATF